MSVMTEKHFQDEWLAKALIYYQVIDQNLYDELLQRYEDEEYFFDVLTKNNYLNADDIAMFVENALKIPTINLDKININPGLIERIPEEICQKYLLIPIKENNKQISVACFNTSNLDAENEIEYLTGKYVKTYFAFKDQIKQKISEYYTPEKLIDSLVDKKKDKSNVRIPGEDTEKSRSPVVNLVNQIFEDAIDKGASDIHIEPHEEGVTVRFRIDGVLKIATEFPRAIHQSLISRIKIISNLNIAETRKPQDGKAKIIADDANIDLRISILPTNYGEKVVTRILDSRKAVVSLEKMGIRGYNKDLLDKCFEIKQGMVLVTGPTGSGKSTTLYAAINRIRSTTNNILTIEDPIEYRMDGINQVQVNEKAGITFASALRSFLRQDPDVILVGEIRDKETAEIAIQAALTGHLVLSTLHTNDTFGTISRLQDIGIDRFKITESLQAIIAQRLVRRLCNDCKIKIKPEDTDGRLINMIKKLGQKPELYKAKGCAKCSYSGYKGRIGVYEILFLDNTLKDMITGTSTIQDIRKEAKTRGFRNLFEDAVSLIAEGIADYKEVLRVINPDSSGSDVSDTGQIKDKPIEKLAPSLDSASISLKTKDDKLSIKTHKAAPGRPKTILVVDDYKVTRMMIRKIIENKTNWKVSEAEDGLKALDEVRQNNPDLIILDIMMPNMDGYEFLQHLRSEESTSKIPVFMLTGLKTVENELKGLELGADDYITKPINPELFIARAKRFIERLENN